MKNTLIIQNSIYAPAGLIESYLRRKSFDYDIKSFKEISDYKEYSHIISLGSEMSIKDNNQNINDQLKIIENSLLKEVKVFGICFGAQLLSKILGYKFVPKGKQVEEYGLSEIKGTPKGIELGLYSEKPLRVLHAHSEGFIVPKDKLLATSTHYDQAFYEGSSLGVQYHPEPDKNSIKEWIGDKGVHKNIANEVLDLISRKEHIQHLESLLDFFYSKS